VKQKEMTMNNLIYTGLLRSIAAVAFAATTGLAFSAQAGECPADKRMPNARQAVSVQGSGVTDTTLGSIDLGKERAKIAGRELRFRKLVIVAGGVVPWHSHDDRPALIYVAEGEIMEYASNCAAPIVHKAGEIRAETYGTSHWWKNLTDKPVVLFVGDVRRDPNDHHM
jgi:quercetin dioxygenase-like cupin family protein